ncbi:hypothetical protein PCANC_15524 [Puccinia coronata f. sp. avenae]|uniref:Uncharacterized protein n=1 Tax=Puccinia coronata f. sp. avenae TaxID=200324 RepID=A0A2N5SIP3_9BASI|nr:hypothetical protein PCANC_15524 [Puccinia coronata f. sp. avenae]PLW29198.1 hypothetical protein PCASD_14609 [Puccinia coronata f. sp. avenae]
MPPSPMFTSNVFSFQSACGPGDISQATRAQSARNPYLISAVTPADSQNSRTEYRANEASHFRIWDWRTDWKTHRDSQVEATAGLSRHWGNPNTGATSGHFLRQIGPSTNHKRKAAWLVSQSEGDDDLSLTLGHSEYAPGKEKVHGNTLKPWNSPVSEPELDLSLALSHSGNARKKQISRPAPTTGLDAAARRVWNAIGFESPLDLSLNMNQPGVVREIASAEPGQSAQVSSLLNPASRPDRRSAFHIWRSNTEKQSVTAISRDKNPANMNGPTFSEIQNENDAPRSSISGSSSRPSTVKSFPKPLPEVSAGRELRTPTSEDESKQLSEVNQAPAEATSTRDHSAKLV